MGRPLGKYVDGRIYRGILTESNKAFVIDRETKDRLIREDPKNGEIIKPFLMGRDVHRYRIPQADRYLILIPKGWTDERAGGQKNRWKWLKENYSSIATQLKPFAKEGESRYDKGYYWWELRACDYYDAFERPKIILPSIVKSAS